jgi:hypothetical protein
MSFLDFLTRRDVPMPEEPAINPQIPFEPIPAEVLPQNFSLEEPPPVPVVVPPAFVEPPTPWEIESMREYYSLQRQDLLQRIADIESMLGFVAVSSEIAVRVAKIEHFLGIKAG